MPPEPVTRGLPPPDPRSLCPVSSTEFVEPPEQNYWVRHWLYVQFSDIHRSVSFKLLCCEYFDGWLTKWQHFRADILSEGFVDAAGCGVWLV
jgi:hypothetical protein